MITKEQEPFGYYDPSDCVFSHPGFYSNEEELIAKKIIDPLYTAEQLAAARLQGADEQADYRRERDQLLADFRETVASVVERGNQMVLLIACNKEIEQASAVNQGLLDALKKVTVHLIAAHSLLQSGGKKAAASDKIFKIMLSDYEKAFEVGREAITAAEQEKTK